MHTLLLCEKTSPELFALQGDLSIAQLPVLDKTITEYHLELVCHQLKSEKITLITGHYQESLKKLLGSGCRWGVELNYQDQLLLNQQLPVLVLPCDRLTSLDLVTFLDRVSENPEQSAIGFAGQIAAVYWITKREDLCDLISGDIPQLAMAIPLSHAVSKPVVSIRDFYDINLGLLRGEFPLVSIKSYANEEHLLLATRASVSEEASVEGRSYIGTNSTVGKQARLDGYCAIQQMVMVDHHAKLQNCVILPNTYVGSWVAIKNAVVSGSFIWQMDTGTCLMIKEKFLLSLMPSGRTNMVLPA